MAQCEADVQAPVTWAPAHADGTTEACAQGHWFPAVRSDALNRACAQTGSWQEPTYLSVRIVCAQCV